MNSRRFSPLPATDPRSGFPRSDAGKNTFAATMVPRLSGCVTMASQEGRTAGKVCGQPGEFMFSCLPQSLSPMWCHAARYAGIVLRALLGIAVLLGAGCQKPQQKYEAKARETLTLLPLLATAARVAPLVTEQSAEGLKGVTDLVLKYKMANALLIHLEDLENPTVRRALPIRADKRSPSVDVATVLHLVKTGATEPLDAKYEPNIGPDSFEWKHMAETRYVLVVRTVAVKDPVLGGAKKFEPGLWLGELLVFELRSQKLLGGFTLTARNSPRVESRTGDVLRNLKSDLTMAVWGNVTAGLRKHFPSVGPNDEQN